MRIRAVLLFSGGKDSVLAYETLRGSVDFIGLVHLHTTLPEPSPHTRNRCLLRGIRKALGLPMDEVRLVRGQERAIIVDYLRRAPCDGLVAADIFLEPHRDWWLEICQEAGKELLEPLWQVPTREVAQRWPAYAIAFIVVGIQPARVPKRWLGTVVEPKDLNAWLADADRYGFDPCGENGELHTMTLYARSFRYRIVPRRVDIEVISPRLHIARVRRFQLVSVP